MGLCALRLAKIHVSHDEVGLLRWSYGSGPIGFFSDENSGHRMERQGWNTCFLIEHIILQKCPETKDQII